MFLDETRSVFAGSGGGNPGGHTTIPAVLITSRHEGDRYDVKGAAHWGWAPDARHKSRSQDRQQNTTRTSCLAAISTGG